MTQTTQPAKTHRIRPPKEEPADPHLIVHPVDIIANGQVSPPEYGTDPYKHLLVQASSTERRRLFLGIPVTGLVRIEWALGRWGQIIPCNWSMADQMHAIRGGGYPLGYDVKDARNVIVQNAVLGNFEWCFRAETLIETQQGAKTICDIQVGDIVKTHLGRYRPVLQTLKRHYPQRNPLLWIRTAHSTIKCTPEHPFYVERAGIRAFIQAQDLCLTDQLLYPSMRTPKDSIPFHIRYSSVGHNGQARRHGSQKYAIELGDVEVTEDLARFFGLYAAEGCGGGCGITFTFNNNETAYIDHVVKVCKEVFGRTPNIRKRWATNVTLNIKPLHRLFTQWFGSKAHLKKVPPFVFEWGLKNRLAFLHGYLEGDGCIPKGGGNTFNSASRELVEDVCRLAETCGLEGSTIWPTKPVSSVYQGQSILGKGAYTARIKTRSWGKLLDLREAHSDNSTFHIPIMAIEEHRVSASLVDDYVYNLEVADDNSYIADCAAVHNCFFNDHDTILPSDCFLKLNEYMRKGDIPLVSGLYFTKSFPAEPLVYRGRGNSYYAKWKLGDKFWVDGCGMGCMLLNVKVLREMWNDAPEYIAGGNQKVRQVFDTPQFQWTDPESGAGRVFTGTEDLSFFDRMRQGDYLAKAGFKKIAKQKYFVLLDSTIFCWHINNDGTKYPIEMKW